MKTKTQTPTQETKKVSRNMYLSRDEKYIISYVFTQWMKSAKNNPIEKLMIDRFQEVQDKFQSVQEEVVEPYELPF